MKKIIFVIFFLLLVICNKSLASTSLVGVALDNYNVSSSYFSEHTAADCGASEFGQYVQIYHDEQQSLTTITGSADPSSGILSTTRCDRTISSRDYTVYWNGPAICDPPHTFSTSDDTGLRCVNYIPYLEIWSGSNGCTHSADEIHRCYGACGAPNPHGSRVSNSESSLTFKLICQSIGMGMLLHIKAHSSVTVTNQVASGNNFLLNGYSPTVASETRSSGPGFCDYYSWAGYLEWVIPINIQCGESITLTPSIANGSVRAAIHSVRAIPRTCLDGQTMPCYAGPAGTQNIGVCRGGMKTCINGQWDTTCTGEVLPQAEICDGLDNNCNGTSDEGFECKAGDTRACYDGLSGTAGVGICRSGTQACNNCQWDATCQGQVLPQQERCDGKDDNCNNKVDEGCDPCLDESGKATAGKP